MHNEQHRKKIVLLELASLIEEIHLLVQVIVGVHAALGQDCTL